MASILTIASAIGTVAQYLKSRQAIQREETPAADAQTADDGLVPVRLDNGLVYRLAPERVGEKEADVEKGRSNPYKGRYHPNMRADLDERAMQEYYDTRAIRTDDWAAGPGQLFVPHNNPRQTYVRPTELNDPHPRA